MQPVLGRALGRPVCRRRPVDGYRQNPPSWNAKTRPEDGKTALCINLCWAAIVTKILLVSAQMPLKLIQAGPQALPRSGLSQYIM